MEQLQQLSEEEFEHIEEEISRTAKGRAFLRRLRRRASGAATEEIRALLEEFRQSWHHQTQALEVANRVGVLRQELIEMAASIERARSEIAALRPPDSDDAAKDDKIITATNELDAIVTSTERASFEILNSAERMMDLIARLREGGADGDVCSALDNEITSIFTACSFQDLTGQRTSKVVNALRYIEMRINAVMAIWSGDAPTSFPIPEGPKDHRPDSHLLCGPQLEGMGVSQGDVDRMLADMAFTSAPAAAAADEDEDDFVPPSPAASAKQSQQDIDSMFAAPAADSKPQSQADIDNMFDAPAPPPAPAPAAPKGKQSQADIDSMFDAPAPPPAPAPAPAAPKGKQSQADIDSMFDAPSPPKAAPPPPAPAAPKGKQSQADIDSMFDAPPPPKAAAKPAPAKPKPAAPAPAPAAAGSGLDQSSIDALFG